MAWPMSPDLAAAPRIDCDAHVPTPTVAQLAPYLPDHWNEYIANAGFNGTMAVSSTYPLGAATSGSSRLGANLEESLSNLRTASLGDNGNARTVVSTHYGVEAIQPPDFTVALSRAVNDWMIGDCLTVDDRLLGSIVVPPQY